LYGVLLRLQNCGRGQPWIFSDLAGHPWPTRGDAQRVVSDPLDSPPNTPSVSWRTTLDGDPVGACGYHRLSAYSQRLSTSPLNSAVATAAGRHLAHLYGGDLTSTDWRHLGRLAGFTNQKPERRTPDQFAPWVKLVHARVGLAPDAEALLQSVRHCAQPQTSPFRINLTAAEPDPIGVEEAITIYRGCMKRWQILERFPQPDWSIWICGWPGICSRKANPLLRSKPSSGSPARIFPATMAIRMATCGAPSLAQLFHPQGALCAMIIRAPPRRYTANWIPSCPSSRCPEQRPDLR